MLRGLKASLSLSLPLLLLLVIVSSPTSTVAVSLGHGSSSSSSNNAEAAKSQKAHMRRATTVKTSEGFQATSNREQIVDPTKDVEPASLIKEFAHSAESVESEQGMEQEAINFVMREADADKDGKLSWNELLEHAKHTRWMEYSEAESMGETDKLARLVWDPESEADLKSLFEAADEDDDGHISPAEIPKMADMEDDESEEEREERHHKHAKDDEEVEFVQEGHHEEKDQVATSLLEQVATMSEEDEDEDEDEDDEKSGLKREDEDDDEEGDEDEPEEVHHFLTELDTNHDGRLSVDEVKSFLTTSKDEHEAGAFGLDANRVEGEFKAADANRDGFLDTSELTSMRDVFEEHASLLQEEEDDHEGPDEEEEQEDDEIVHDGIGKGHGAIQETFQAIDLDKDGEVTFEDIKAKLVAATDISRMQTDFKNADADHDDKLSSKEFDVFADELIARMGDLAGDLFIPTAEAAKAQTSQATTK